MVAQSIFFDCDLFFLSKDPLILVHVATAGAVVSDDIWTNPVHGQTRVKLKKLPGNLRTEYKISEGVEKIIESKERQSKKKSINFDRKAYLHDFIEYAKCGCYSFDKTNINDPNYNCYHLVAYPASGFGCDKIIEYVNGDGEMLLCSAEKINENDLGGKIEGDEFKIQSWNFIDIIARLKI